MRLTSTRGAIAWSCGRCATLFDGLFDGLDAAAQVRGRHEAVLLLAFDDLGDELVDGRGLSQTRERPVELLDLGVLAALEILKRAGARLAIDEGAHEGRQEPIREEERARQHRG